MNAMTTIRRTGRMLTAADEASLFVQHVAGERRATHELLEAHMPLINKIAGKYSRFGKDHDELVQEGAVGFIQGLNHFDPELGYRINTLCRWWIRAAISEWVRSNHSLLKIGTTAAQKKAYGSLKEAKSRLSIYDDARISSVDIARLAKDIGIPESDVREMSIRLSPNAITSLDARLPGADGEGVERVDQLADESAMPGDMEEALDDMRRHAAMLTALDHLDARKRDIIQRRYLAEEVETLADVADVHGVSRERVRQLEVQAIETLGLSLPAALSNLVGQERRTARQL